MDRKPSAGIGMSWTASQYAVQVTRAVKAAGGSERLLEADPRRWFLRVENGPAAGGSAFVLPAPGPDGSDAVAVTNLPRESKWRDEMAATTGEWYWIASIGQVVYITEVLYVGG